MRNPKEELSEYYNNLLFRYFQIHSITRQLNKLTQWETQQRRIALDIGDYFFELFRYSAGRMVILDLFKLVSESEEKSIIDWINLARVHWKALDISRAGLSSDRRVRIPLKKKEYEQVLDTALDGIRSHEQVIESLKAYRDKDIAHNDSSVFNDPTKLRELYPLTDIDISSLLDTVSSILKEQHSLIFHSSLTMEVSSIKAVDVVLKYIRVFDRVWKDKKITKDCKIRVSEYLQDDYSE